MNDLRRPPSRRAAARSIVVRSWVWSGRTTELESPLLEILGFRQTQSGRQVDARFLDTDLEAAKALQADAQRWRKPDYVRRAVREASKWRHFAR